MVVAGLVTDKVLRAAIHVVSPQARAAAKVYIDSMGSPENRQEICS